MRPLAVGIVGCGTAGPTAALLLAEAGHDVTLIERVAEPGPVGAGIVLQPSGMAVLAHLGLLEPVLAAGAPLDGLYVETPQRRRLLDLRYHDLSPALFGLGLHRGVLFETLMSKVRATPSIRLCLGVEAREVKREGEKMYLSDAQGERRGPFDLILVCDGARSKLQDVLAPERRVKKYPWGALWFVGKIEGEPQRRLHQVVEGTRRMLGLLPTGRAPGSTDHVASLFSSFKVDTLAAFRAGDFAAWKRAAASDLPAAAPIIDQIRSSEELLVSEYHDVRMSQWHGEGVVWLGDAAHATSPQLGQGCNLALIDSLELAACLARHQHLPLALAEYTRRRRAHLGYYQFMTRALTPFFQSDRTWLGPIRDLVFALTHRMPVFGTQMLVGMAGIHRGPFRARMTLPQLPALPALSAAERK